MFKENEIENARKYLIESHKGHNTGNGDFKYIKSTQKEDFKRLIFKKGTDNSLLYVALSEEDRNDIIKIFEEKMGNNYTYLDSILSTKLGKGVHHRFYTSKSFNTSFTFMKDDGTIFGGHYSVD